MKQNAKPESPWGPGGFADHEQAESGRCPKCGAANPADQKFCSNCGTCLWDVCFGCGQAVSASERFCGTCGANLTAGLDGRIEEVERDLLEARRLELSCQYEQAIALLEPLTHMAHSRLAAFAAQAKELTARLKFAQEQGQATAEAGLEQARTLIANADYEAAVGVLQQVPPPLRTAAIDAELTAAYEKVEEIESLDDRLRAAVAEKQRDVLLETVNRLLELQPRHAEALRLGQQLRNWFCRAAKERFVRYKFDEAVSLVERVPPAVETPEVVKLREAAVEMAWLNWDLRTAPFVDKALLSTSARLRKRTPDDPAAGKLLAELEQRTRQAAQNGRPAHIAWASPPERTMLGPPIERVAGFRRIGIRPETSLDVLQQRPGRFLTAIGLALQALGKGHVDINLQPEEEGGLLRRARRAMRRLPSDSAWGIDLSSSGMKAVKLAQSDKGQGVAVEACELIEHRKTLSQAVNAVEERELIEETISAFYARHELKGSRVALGLPGIITVCRHMRLPPMEAKRIPAAVQYEVRHHLPHGAGDLVWGYQVMGSPADPSDDARECNVLLVAVRREQLTRYLDKVRALRDEFDVIQSDPLALHNLAAYEHFDDFVQGEAAAPRGGHALALLDAGADGTCFVVSSPGHVWFRNIGVAGHSLTRAMVLDLNMTYAQAEKLKRDPADAPMLGRIHQALEPVYKDLLNETLASLGAHDKTHGKNRIQRFLAVGGSFDMHGLLRFLRAGE